MLKAIAESVLRFSSEPASRVRFYPGLERAGLSRGARAQLLLTQITRAIEHQQSPLRPWQRYEPLSAFLDPEIWGRDEMVLLDLSFAKLAIQLLSDAQRQQLEIAISEDEDDEFVTE